MTLQKKSKELTVYNGSHSDGLAWFESFETGEDKAILEYLFL